MNKSDIENTIEHLQKMRLANRGRLTRQTSGPVPFETYICSNVYTFSPEFFMFPDFEFRTSLGTSTLLYTFLRFRI